MSISNLSDEEHSQILKALADETRLRLMRLLLQEELNVQEICDITTLPQPKISRHLAVLKNCGLVSLRRDGTRIYYAAVNMQEKCSSLSAYISAITSSEHSDTQRMAVVLLKRASESRKVMNCLADQWEKVISSLHNPAASIFALAGFAPRGMTIADLGCGTGLLLPLLARLDGEVYAVDQSEAMLNRARERCSELKLKNMNFIQADLADGEIDIPDCDAQLLHFVLHQIPSPQSLLKRIANNCKAGGRLIIVDMEKHDDESTRERFGSVWLGFEENQLKEWLSEAGFDEVNFLKLQEESNDSKQKPFVCIAVKN